jgi:hypothetical protein
MGETNLDLAAKGLAVLHPQRPPGLALGIGMKSDVVLLDDEDLEALDEPGPLALALGRRLETPLQDGVLVAEEAARAANPGLLAVIGEPDDRHRDLVLGEDALDLVLVDVVERVVERLPDFEFGLAEGTFEEHLVEAGKEVDASAADGVGSVVTSDSDLVDMLLGLQFCAISIYSGVVTG